MSAASTQPKLLVTGAAGFIGARFVESCNSRGIAVISVDRRAYFGERKEHAGIRFGKIVDMDELLPLLERGGIPGEEISGIVHIGACSSTTEINVEFLKAVNTDYSKALWSFAAKEGVPFVYASSAATYGEGEQGYDDDEKKLALLKPLNPYGQSKQDFDLWALAEEKAGRAPRSWSGFKFFNVYGFGERHKGSMASVVLHAFDQIQAKGQVRLFKSHREGIADGHQKRDFVAVDDVVDVMHFALSKPLSRGIYNLGSGQARTFLDLARAVFASLGRPEKIEFIDTPLSIRDRYQYFTEARMERLRAQGYTRPFTSLEDGVRAYVKRLQAAEKA